MVSRSALETSGSGHRRAQRSTGSTRTREACWARSTSESARPDPWWWTGRSGSASQLGRPHGHRLARLEVLQHLGCCAPERGYAAARGGSLWVYDTPTGTVERWDDQTYQGISNIHVTDPPLYYGQCLTAIAAGARAVWVTAAANVNYHCSNTTADTFRSSAAGLSRSSVSPQSRWPHWPRMSSYDAG